MLITCMLIAAVLPLLSDVIRVSPRTGIEPLSIAVVIRPQDDWRGRVCVTAESDVGGWNRSCWDHDPDLDPATTRLVYTLDAGEWQVWVTHRGKQVGSKLTVIVVERGDSR